MTYPLAIAEYTRWSAQLHGPNPCNECDRLKKFASAAIGRLAADTLVRWQTHLWVVQGVDVRPVGRIIATIRRITGVVGLTSGGFWALGIAGHLGVDVAYLTDADAFVFLSGNSLEGGWGLNYAMVIALGLTVVSFLLRKVGREEE